MPAPEASAGTPHRLAYAPPLSAPPPHGLFPTFFLGGFECSTFIWKDRQRRDYVVRTAHDRHLEADYERVQSLGFGVVREAIRWPIVDRGGGYYNWSTVDPVVAALNRYRITPIWDLCHYGFPDGCNPLEDACLERFVTYCRAVAEEVAPRVRRPHFFTPVNEINFLSGAATDMGWVYPFAKGKYHEMKLALCRMSIEGAKAIREVLPEARMVHVDPIIHEVPPDDRPELADLAWHHAHVEAFEAWDMLAGRLHPELGGAPEILDVVGVNVYNFCQAQVNADGSRTVLGPRDPRRKTLGELLLMAWERYRRPVIIGETSGYQDERPTWFRMVMEESMRALNSGVDLRRWQHILGHPEEVSTQELRTKRLGTVDLQEIKRYAREWEERTPGPQNVQPGTDTQAAG